MIWLDDYLEAWNRHDADAVARFVAEDATWEDMAMGLRYDGRDAIRTCVGETEKFSSDFRFLPAATRECPHHFVVEWEMAGTNDGAVRGLPATGKPFRVSGVWVGLLNSDGEISQSRTYWNAAAYLAQTGLISLPS